MFPFIFKGAYETCMGCSPTIQYTKNEESFQKSVKLSHRINDCSHLSKIQDIFNDKKIIDLFFSVLTLTFQELHAEISPPTPSSLNSMSSGVVGYRIIIQPV